MRSLIWLLSFLPLSVPLGAVADCSVSAGGYCLDSNPTDLKLEFNMDDGIDYDSYISIETPVGMDRIGVDKDIGTDVFHDPVSNTQIGLTGALPALLVSDDGITADWNPVFTNSMGMLDAQVQKFNPTVDSAPTPLVSQPGNYKFQSAAFRFRLNYLSKVHVELESSGNLLVTSSQGVHKDGIRVRFEPPMRSSSQNYFALLFRSECKKYTWDGSPKSFNNANCSNFSSTIQPSNKKINQVFDAGSASSATVRYFTLAMVPVALRVGNTSSALEKILPGTYSSDLKVTFTVE